ncbi:MAG TPA: ribulokinase [Candidatus Hydrogenedentes bacterium]|nr:ribulokinase [Candidatus Hydrogenedentota bacterium]
MTGKKFAIGIDFGTNSVRAVVADVATGEEVATAVFNYPSGQQGILVDDRDPDLARQHPADYLAGMESVVREAVNRAKETPGFTPEAVVGIGVDTTGSTPLPVDATGQPLALQPDFARDLNAMAWLWKDHTSHREAAEITARAAETRPRYLAKCGGVYSSEWFWSKLLHCRRVAPDVFNAMHTWVEHVDWITGLLTGTDHPSRLKRCVCAASHKAMFHPSWGGYPDEEFLSSLDPELVRIRRTLPDTACSIAEKAGNLTTGWAEKFGLPAGIPVAMGAFDAHLGAVGSGIQPGTLVKIIGTSCCDMMVAPLSQPLPDIPGLCGIVPESILPGCHGLEAGQSAVGDIFNWFVSVMKPAGETHETLTEKAAALRPGESGLLGLDWNNGNRTVLVDQRLTGLVVGTTLHTRPEEVYRALIEATAFGARVIMERFLEYDVRVDRVVNCGGISGKNSLLMQIYADVLNRPLEVTASSQTCAMGAAMAGAVAGGAHADFASAARTMVRMDPKVYQPNPRAVAVYDRLFGLYRRLHDAFGIRGSQVELYSVMKDLLDIRDAVRRG